MPDESTAEDAGPTPTAKPNMPHKAPEPDLD